MKTAVRRLAFASFLFIMSPAAHAAGNPFSDCRDDAQKFCKDVQPGQGRIKDCLEDHYKEISDACYADLKSVSSSAQHSKATSSDNTSSTDDDKQ